MMHQLKFTDDYEHRTGRVEDTKQVIFCLKGMITTYTLGKENDQAQALNNSSCHTSTAPIVQS